MIRRLSRHVSRKKVRFNRCSASVERYGSAGGRREDTGMWCTLAGVIVTFTLSILAAPLDADVQQAGKVPRLGVVFPAELPSPEESHLAAFRQALRHLGYVEGQTVAIASRYALGRAERFPELIAELLRLPVDLLVTGSQPAAVA